MAIVFNKQFSKLIVDHNEKMKTMGVVPKFMQSKKTYDEQISFHRKYSIFTGIGYLIVSLIIYFTFEF